MSGRPRSRSTWGHVGSVRLRSTSSGVGVDVGTPFISSCRRSLVVALEAEAEVVDGGVEEVVTLEGEESLSSDVPAVNNSHEAGTEVSAV